MNVSEIEWKKQKGILLENEKISIVLLPELGSKTASLYSKATNFELAAQYRSDYYSIPYIGADFSEYDASGMDDTFPNINESDFRYASRSWHYPDHGEIWSSAFQYDIENNKVHLIFKSTTFSYQYEKWVHLEDDEVVYTYRIINNDTHPFPCIWTFHGLFTYTEDMGIFYPKDRTKVLNVFESSLLGDVGKVLELDNGEYNFFGVPGRTSNSLVKYYLEGKCENGSCGFYYPEKNLKVSIKYDCEKLPYLGVWITAGGYRGDYNCALEPSNGFYDEVGLADKNDSLFLLQPKAPLEFTLRIKTEQYEKKIIK
jgi:galactose mutarotase-like enzyme